jgi:hypothetical protein
MDLYSPQNISFKFSVTSTLIYNAVLAQFITCDKNIKQKYPYSNIQGT